MRERRGRVRVQRLWVAAAPRKTTARRLAFYGSFAAGAAPAVALQRRHDVMFASSPPLPGVLAAAAAARAQRVPVVVDIRDLWPAAAQALGELSYAPLLRAFERGERWLYRNAAAVTATTRPFCAQIDRIARRPVSVHLPNGALDSLVARPPAPPPPAPPFVVGYAGNLGIAQGLEGVLGAAERLRDRDVRFVLVGDGPLREHLAAAIRSRALGNVELRPPVPVDRVGAFLESCHALLVPLGGHPVLADFIPSKLYDAMAVGRPAIVAAHGEAARLVTETGAGVAVAPEDGDALASAIAALAQDLDLGRALGAAGRRSARGLTRSRQLDRLERVFRDAASS